LFKKGYFYQHISLKRDTFLGSIFIHFCAQSSFFY
jgi:hypothetical protein